ncbi:hypothetical protein [Sphingomonas sp.]|uniref:hypothetical protein n=1 Tax=Sphingomonas sp. TaxID=28214 RepID=UPI003B00BE2B
MPAELTQRQKEYLRLVARGHTSFEIARLVSTPDTTISPTAVDKQLKKAMAVYQVGDRKAAARRLIAEEAGVQALDPPANGPSMPVLQLLPLPLPTEAAPRQNMTGWQILAWGLIIAVTATVGLLGAVLLLDSLSRIVGGPR